MITAPSIVTATTQSRKTSQDRREKHKPELIAYPTAEEAEEACEAFRPLYKPERYCLTKGRYLIVAPMGTWLEIGEMWDGRSEKETVYIVENERKWR